MRTIDQIKESIAADFMKNEEVAEAFGFRAGDDFAAHFSKVSVVNLLFYIFAAAAWVVEKLFETHRSDIEMRIEEILPHGPGGTRPRCWSSCRTARWCPTPTATTPRP